MVNAPRLLLLLGVGVPIEEHADRSEAVDDYLGTALVHPLKQSHLIKY